MWMARTDVPGGETHVSRVKMDGTQYQDLSDEFSGAHHDFAVLPDERIAFIARNEGELEGCSDIKLWDEGSVSTVVNSGDAVGADSCHCNAIQYSAQDETLVFSDLSSNTYAKVTLEGEVVWTLSGDGNGTITGVEWYRQHGLDVLGLSSLLVFINGADAGDPSRAVEFELDLDNGVASETWSYWSDEGLSNPFMGDVQRLPNGNTLVTYSYLGIIHEVDVAKAVLREYVFDPGTVIAYTMLRNSLYGPPPK